ncbi:MAG: hypothetical protein J6W73_06265, partial [Verrucomicrobia bacterium]|nr:hypothetical protein [Verrucomicrobiota bacterium]
ITVPMKVEGPAEAWMMADPKVASLKTETTEEGLRITMNTEYQNPYDSVVVLRAKGKVIEAKK